MTPRRFAHTLVPAAALLLGIVPLAADGPAAALRLRERYRVTDKDGRVVAMERTVAWAPKETVVIVCDMWDQHHCPTAVERVKELAPRIDRFLEKARGRGVFIIHAPSACMDAYKGHPARRRAQAAPKAANLPRDIGDWCHKIPAEEKVAYPIEQSDGLTDCDCTEAEQRAYDKKLIALGRNPKAPWKGQIDTIRIRDEDAISDSGVEIWNLLEQRGIKNVILVGVHANMCVLGRPFGLRQMVKNGKNAVLVRDLTDTMYTPRRRPYVSHFRGTELLIAYIERAVCPTITSDQLLGGRPFHFKGDPAAAALP
jgi:nicotinamidase-related amidase